MSHYILSGLYLLYIDRLTDLEAKFDTSFLEGEENYSEIKCTIKNTIQLETGFLFVFDFALKTWFVRFSNINNIYFIVRLALKRITKSRFTLMYKQTH